MAKGGALAGYIAYEAGLALEPKLSEAADARSGAGGPLVWLGLFDREQVIPAADMPAWLEARAPGQAALGPLEPQLSFGAYSDAFARLQEAIRAATGAGFSIVCPGIRPGGPVGDDQKRTVGVAQAFADGADAIVVGRPIRLATDPQAAARAIQQEIASALAAR